MTVRVMDTAERKLAEGIATALADDMLGHHGWTYIEILAALCPTIVNTVREYGWLPLPASPARFKAALEHIIDANGVQSEPSAYEIALAALEEVSA